MMTHPTLTTHVAALATLVANGYWTTHENILLDPEQGVTSTLNLLKVISNNGRRVFVIGNGGSAAVASHVVNDLVNMTLTRAHSLSDPALLSCMTNDFGHDVALSRILEVWCERGDLLIAISSSGRSANICIAANTARRLGATVMTLTGFEAENQLRKLGDINLWLDSKNYGLVETGHAFVLHHLTDRRAQQVKADRE
jgi:D-sedoheptulose 7-phosphate isomerase